MNSTQEWVPKEYPPVHANEFDHAVRTLVDSYPNFNSTLVAYVDKCTINRDSYDFYSWGYWGMRSDGYSSICAFVGNTYALYNKFRKLQNPADE